MLRSFDYTLIMSWLVDLKCLDLDWVVVSLQGHWADTLIRFRKGVLGYRGEIIMEKWELQDLRSCASLLRGYFKHKLHCFMGIVRETR